MPAATSAGASVYRETPNEVYLGRFPYLSYTLSGVLPKRITPPKRRHVRIHGSHRTPTRDVDDFVGVI